MTIYILWTCGAIALVVSAVMVRSIVNFRHAETASRAPRRTLVEVLWALIPVLILFGTAVPAVRDLVATEDQRRIEAQSEMVRQAAVLKLN